MSPALYVWMQLYTNDMSGAAPTIVQARGNPRCWCLHIRIEKWRMERAGRLIALWRPLIQPWNCLLQRAKKIPYVRYFQVAVPLTCSQKHSKGYTMTISFYSTKWISSNRPENWSTGYCRRNKNIVILQAIQNNIFCISIILSFLPWCSSSIDNKHYGPWNDHVSQMVTSLAVTMSCSPGAKSDHNPQQLTL